MNRLARSLPILALAFWGFRWPASTNGLTAHLQAEPVVRAVLFYSPTCPVCQKVITEDLPPLIETYGDRLQIIGINVAVAQGQALYQAAIQRFGISDDRLGVPTLIVGDVVLLGSIEIPEQFPALIESGLAQGGVDWPDIPGLAEALASIPTAPAAGTQTQQATGTAQISPVPTGEVATQVPTSPGATAPAVSPDLPDTTGERPTPFENFMRDPVGNGLAVAVLIGMVVSVIVVASRVAKGPVYQPAPWKSWAVPILCLAGVIVAGYLTYVESKGVRAVCGPVGDCNTVQQSPYAKLFGILPVGALGLAGYVVIFLAWLLSRKLTGRFSDWAAVAVLGLAGFGTIFSLVLTFLEPFVIGATCIWCLSSAVIMTALMWLASGPAVKALQQLEGENGAGDEPAPTNPGP